MLAGQTLCSCPARHSNYLTASIFYCRVAVSPHEFCTVKAVLECLDINRLIPSLELPVTLALWCGESGLLDV